MKKNYITISDANKDIMRSFGKTHTRPEPFKVQTGKISGKWVKLYKPFEGSAKALVLPKMIDSELQETVISLWLKRQMVAFDKATEVLNQAISMTPSELVYSTELPSVVISSDGKISLDKSELATELLNEKILNEKPSFEALVVKTRLVGKYVDLATAELQAEIALHATHEQWVKMAEVICDLLPYVQTGANGSIREIPEKIAWTDKIAPAVIDGTAAICKEWDALMSKDGATTISGKSKQLFADTLRKNLGAIVPADAVCNLPMAEIVKVWKLTQSAYKVDKAGAISEGDILQSTAIRQVVLAWLCKYNAKLA